MAHLPPSGNPSTSRLLVQHRGSVHRLSSPACSSQLVISGGEDGQVFLADLRAPFATKLAALRDRRERKVQVYSLQCSPCDPLHLCLTGRDSSLRIQDLRNMQVGQAR